MGIAWIEIWLRLRHCDHVRSKPSRFSEAPSHDSRSRLPAPARELVNLVVLHAPRAALLCRVRPAELGLVACDSGRNASGLLFPVIFAPVGALE